MRGRGYRTRRRRSRPGDLVGDDDPEWPKWTRHGEVNSEAGSRARGRHQHGGAGFGLNLGRNEEEDGESTREEKSENGWARELYRVSAMLHDRTRVHEVAIAGCRGRHARTPTPLGATEKTMPGPTGGAHPSVAVVKRREGGSSLTRAWVRRFG